MKIPIFSAVFALAMSGASLFALELNPLFTDHAVLQQELPVPVWGTAKSEQKVTVTFGEQEKTANADAEGNWMVILDPLVASADPAEMKVTAGEKSITISDVLVGEVWVGSGQSNMGWTVERTLSGEKAKAAADKGEYEGLRLFKVPVKGEDERQSKVNAQWAVPNSSTVASFSATAFYFGSQLLKDRSVPIGMIQSANGGTNAFSWINTDTLNNDPIAETIRTYWASTVENHPAAMKKYEAALAKWKEKVAAAKKEGKTVEGRAPREPLGPDHVKRPAGHYNAMVAPLQPYAIRGVVWYQGEANSRMPFYPGYKDLMLGLVEDWRTDWATASNGELEKRKFPFYLVQLPNFAGGDAEGWPGIREQMLKFWEEGENTGMVVTIDTGDAKDIHPQNKKPVGERLAAFARANTYGENIVFSGPIFDSIQIEGDKAVVSFRYVGSGLSSLNGEELKYFEIAGADGEFHPAKAEIKDDKLIVTGEGVSEPRAVRYAWVNNPENPNFGNKDGFPASPFRTDSW